MSLPVGITVPKLLPITGTFAPAFAIYHCILAIRVSQVRINSNTLIGDRTKATSSSASAGPEADALLVATRCHSNFAENVPFAVLLGAVVEMNGGNRTALTAAFATLLAARILHVELGMRAKKSMGTGRPVGHAATMAFIVSMSGYAAWLVKGYWGF